MLHENFNVEIDLFVNHGQEQNKNILLLIITLISSLYWPLKTLPKATGYLLVD
jgi:hypothetical protein